MLYLDYIPMTEEETDWSNPGHAERLAWKRADFLLHFCSLQELSVEIPMFYSLGLHWREVKTGGHRQFLAGLPARNRPWVLSSCVAAAQRMYPSGLAACFERLIEWVEQHPGDHQDFSGHESGHIDALDHLDEIIAEADVSSDQHLLGLIAESADLSDVALVRSVLNKTANDTSHLNAMRIIWLRRSGLIRLLSDAQVDDIFDALRLGQPLSE